jgi:hypothetical protein
MKTALIITGFLRSNQHVSQSFTQFVNDDVDIYACCWSINSTGSSGGKSRTDLTPVSVDDLYTRYGENVKTKIVDYYNYQLNRPYTFKVLEDRPDDVFKVAPRAIHHLNGDFPQRIVDMFYMIKEARDMVPDFSQYDLVVKTRHDMFIDQPINFVLNNSLNVDNHQQILDVNANASMHGYQDRSNLTHLDMNPFGISYQLAWGKPDIMYQYMGAHDHLKTMYETSNVDMSAFEHVNAYYIQKVIKAPFIIHNVEHQYHFVR